MNNWIDVNERLPESNEMVMTFRLLDGECAHAGIGMWDYNKIEGFEFMANDFGTVTHWQKLPEPPKQKDSE